MKRGEKIIYFILACIPIGFILFLLAMVNVLFFLLGVIVVLLILVILKNAYPQMFSWKKDKPVTRGPSTVMPNSEKFKPVVEEPKVYMVLSGREDFGARRISINKASYSIGRGRDNDFSLEGTQISRHHLKIEYNSVESICYAIDAGSSNGTYLNSERMIAGQRYRLIQGDRLMIDGRIFIVEYARY